MFKTEVIADDVVLDESNMVNITEQVKTSALIEELNNRRPSLAWRRRCYEAEHRPSAIDEIKGMFMGLAIKAFS